MQVRAFESHPYHQGQAKDEDSGACSQQSNDSNNADNKNDNDSINNMYLSEAHLALGMWTITSIMIIFFYYLIPKVILFTMMHSHVMLKTKSFFFTGFTNW